MKEPEFTKKQIELAAARIKKLKELSYELNSPYKRRKKDPNKKYYTLGECGENKGELKANNPFLHDQVDFGPMLKGGHEFNYKEHKGFRHTLQSIEDLPKHKALRKDLVLDLKKKGI